MKNLEELVSLYLEQSDGGKSYTNNAKSLRTWARQNNANVTIDSLLQWINNGVRKTTKPKNKIGFINHFIRFLNSRGIHTIVPLRNSLIIIGTDKLFSSLLLPTDQHLLICYSLQR